MIKARLDISLQKPVNGGPFSTDLAQGCMTTLVWTETMTRFMKVRSLWAVVNAFEYGANNLLHDFIACGGNPQFSFFAVWFGDVDRSDRLELKLLCAHLLDNLVNHVQRKPVNGLLV